VRPRGRNRRRTPPPAQLKFTTSAPVVIVRAERQSTGFSYSVEEWVRVVAARRIWPLAVNLEQMRIELEAAGQLYQAAQNRRAARGRRSRTKLQRAMKQVYDLAALADLQFTPEEDATLRTVQKKIESKLNGRRYAERTALIQSAVQTWRSGTGEARGFSRSSGKPTGPLIRFLTAALAPILKDAMPGREVFAKIIRS
jgi:hypothetical protein